MAFKQKGWSAFAQESKENKRYYREKTWVDPDDTKSSWTKETFGSGGREGDKPKKHKQVTLHKFTEGDEDTFYKKKQKRNRDQPTKSKRISEPRYKIESGIRKLFTRK